MKSIGALSHQYRANYHFHHCKTILTYQDMFWRVHNRCGVFDRDCNKDLYNKGHILSSTQNTLSIHPEMARTFSMEKFMKFFYFLPCPYIGPKTFKACPKKLMARLWDQGIFKIGQKAKFDNISQWELLLMFKVK